jgi:poly(3-hydroxybutyrate) depolymerase
MSRQFYHFAIYLFVILILQEILITTMLMSVGRGAYALGSFMPYFILVSVTQACCSVIAMLYCYGRQYIWPFRASWLCIIMLSVNTAIVYEILVNQNLQSWYYYSYCAVSAANLVLGISLVASKSREHFWLKWIGIASICVDTAQIALLIWYNVFADFQMKAILSQATFMFSWLMVAITGLWIIHFGSEVKAIKSLNSIPRVSLVGFILVAAIVSYFSISLGSNFFEESRAPLPVRNVSATERALADRFESHLFINHNGENLPYRLMKPLDYDSTQKYPVVLCLHHGRAHGRDNVAQVQGSYGPVLANYDNRRNHPAFLLIPQCEVGKNWMDPDVDSAIMELIASMEKQYSIDTLQRYVIGESGGGYGSWHFIGNHPGLFAAAIPVCGGGEEGLVKNMADVSIWAFHGSDDLLVPVSYSRKMVNALRKAGSKPRYTQFAGADHYIGKRVAETPGVWDWLFMQRRKI